MANADLENALHHVRVMQDLLAQPGGNVGAKFDQAQVLAALELLSGSLSRRMADRLCQQRLAELRGFAHASSNGSEFLRLQTLKSLNALEELIRIGFKMRSTTAAHKVLPLSRSERARRAPRAAKKAS